MPLHSKIVKGFGSDEWRPSPQPFTPTAFAERLDEVFGGRLRIRWSFIEGAWHIEERLPRRAVRPPTGLNRYRDDYVRAADGYGLVMRVHPGTKAPCPVCHLDVSLPVMETAEVTCTNCTRKGRDGKFWGAYFPLGECLIDHLRLCSPEGQDQIARVRRESEAGETLKRRAAESQAREGAAQFGDALRDQLPKAGFPSLVPDSWRH